MCSLWPESFHLLNKSWKSVPSFTLVFFFIFHPAPTPNMPLRSYRKDERDAYHHRRRCEIIVSMEMVSNCKAIINSEVSTLVHWWYLTFIDEEAVMRAEELIKPPRSPNYDWCLYHLETGLTTACLQITLLGLIYQAIEIGHWVPICGEKKKISAFQFEYLLHPSKEKPQHRPFIHIHDITSPETICKLYICEQVFSVQQQLLAKSKPQINSKLPPVQTPPGEHNGLTNPFSAGPCWFVTLTPSTRRSILV